MKTKTTLVILCLITQVLHIDGLRQLKNSLASSDSPLLMKVLELVDAATSNEHLLQVTLKLLGSLCACMRETLKVKEDYFNITKNSIDTKKIDSNEGKVFDLYIDIYNNSCFNLRQELTNRTHKLSFEEESTLLNHTNCGKDEKTETYNKRSDSEESPAVKHSIPSKLEQVLYKALIETKDLHDYTLRKYELFSKSSTSQVQRALQRFLIVILTLHPDGQEVTGRKNYIDEKDLNTTLYKKSPIDVDIIDSKHDENLKENDKSIMTVNLSECNLQSLYKFLTESDRDNLTKVFKFIRKSDTIKVYVEVNIKDNHTEFIHICCENDTTTSKCKNYFKNLSKTKFLDDSYINTITKIKSLVNQYENQLNATHHNTSIITANDEHKKEKIIIESIAKEGVIDDDRIDKKENDLQSDTKLNESSKLSEVTQAIVLLNDYVTKQTTKKYSQTYQTDSDRTWTDFSTTYKPININITSKTKGQEENFENEWTNSLQFNESNKVTNTGPNVPENGLKITTDWKKDIISNDTLPMFQEKHEVEEKLQQASTSRTDKENSSNNSLMIISSTGNDSNTKWHTINILQNTTVANKLNTVIPTVYDDEEFTKFSSPPLTKNTTLISDLGITQSSERNFDIKVNDTEITTTILTTQTTDETLQYSLNATKLSMKNLALLTNLQTTEIPKEYFTTDLSTSQNTLSIQNKKAKTKTKHNTIIPFTTPSTQYPMISETFYGEMQTQSITKQSVPVDSTTVIKNCTSKKMKNKTSNKTASKKMQTDIGNALPHEMTTKKYEKFTENVNKNGKNFMVHASKTNTDIIPSESPITKNISTIHETTITTSNQKIAKNTPLESITTITTFDLQAMLNQPFGNDIQDFNTVHKGSDVDPSNTVASHVTIEDLNIHTMQKIKENITKICTSSTIATSNIPTQVMAKVNNDDSVISDDFIDEEKSTNNKTNSGAFVNTNKNMVIVKDLLLSPFFENTILNEQITTSTDAVTSEIVTDQTEPKNETIETTLAEISLLDEKTTKEYTKWTENVYEIEENLTFLGTKFPKKYENMISPSTPETKNISETTKSTIQETTISTFDLSRMHSQSMGNDLESLDNIDRKTNIEPTSTVVSLVPIADSNWNTVQKIKPKDYISSTEATFSYPTQDISKPDTDMSFTELENLIGESKSSSNNTNDGTETISYMNNSLSVSTEGTTIIVEDIISNFLANNQSTDADIEDSNTIDTYTKVELMSTGVPQVTIEEPNVNRVRNIEMNITKNDVPEISSTETTFMQPTQDFKKPDNDMNAEHSEIIDDFTVDDTQLSSHYTNAKTEQMSTVVPFVPIEESNVNIVQKMETKNYIPSTEATFSHFALDMRPDTDLSFETKSSSNNTNDGTETDSFMNNGLSVNTESTTVTVEDIISTFLANNQSTDADMENLNTIDIFTKVEPMNTGVPQVTIEEPNVHTVQKIKVNITKKYSPEISSTDTTFRQSTQDFRKPDIEMNAKNSEIFDDFTVDDTQLSSHYTNVVTKIEPMSTVVPLVPIKEFNVNIVQKMETKHYISSTEATFSHSTQDMRPETDMSFTVLDNLINEDKSSNDTTNAGTETDSYITDGLSVNTEGTTVIVEDTVSTFLADSQSTDTDMDDFNSIDSLTKVELMSTDVPQVTIEKPNVLTVHKNYELGISSTETTFMQPIQDFQKPDNMSNSSFTVGTQLNNNYTNSVTETNIYMTTGLSVNTEKTAQVIRATEVTVEDSMPTFSECTTDIEPTLETTYAVSLEMKTRQTKPKKKLIETTASEKSEAGFNISIPNETTTKKYDIESFDTIDEMESMSPIISHATIEEPDTHNVQKIVAPSTHTLDQPFEVLGKVDNGKKSVILTTGLSINTEENAVNIEDSVTSISFKNTTDIEINMKNTDADSSEITTYLYKEGLENDTTLENVKTYSPNYAQNETVLLNFSEVTRESNIEATLEAYTIQTSTYNNHPVTISIPKFTVSSEDITNTTGLRISISEVEDKQTVSDTTEITFTDHEYGLTNYKPTVFKVQQPNKTSTTLQTESVKERNDSNLISISVNDLASDLKEIKFANKILTDKIPDIENQTKKTSVHESEIEMTDTTFKITTSSVMETISAENLQNKVKVQNNNDLSALPREESVLYTPLDKDTSELTNTSLSKFSTLKQNLSLNINTSTESVLKVIHNVSNALSNHNTSFTSTKTTPNELAEFSREYVTIKVHTVADNLSVIQRSTFADKEWSSIPESLIKRPSNNISDHTSISSLLSPKDFTTELHDTVVEEVTTLKIELANKQTVVPFTMPTFTMAINPLLEPVTAATIKTKEKHHEGVFADAITTIKSMPSTTFKAIAMRNTSLYNEIEKYGTTLMQNVKTENMNNQSNVEDIEIKDEQIATKSTYIDSTSYEKIQKLDLNVMPPAISTLKTFDGKNLSAFQTLSYQDFDNETMTTLSEPEIIKFKNNRDVEKPEISTLFVTESTIPTYTVSTPVTYISTDTKQNAATNKQSNISNMHTEQILGNKNMETTHYAIEAFKTTLLEASSHAALNSSIISANEVTQIEELEKLNVTLESHSTVTTIPKSISTITNANNYSEKVKTISKKTSKSKIILKKPMSFELNIRVGVEANKDGIKFSILDEKESVVYHNASRVPTATCNHSNQFGDNAQDSLLKSEIKFVNKTEINTPTSLESKDIVPKNITSIRRSNVVNEEDLSRIAEILHKLSWNPPTKRPKISKRMKTRKSFVENTTIIINENIKPLQTNITSSNMSATSPHKNFTKIKHKSIVPGALIEDLAIPNIKSIYKEHMKKIKEGLNNTETGNTTSADIMKKNYEAMISFPVTENITISTLNISGANNISEKYVNQENIKPGLTTLFRATNDSIKGKFRLNKETISKKSKLINKKISNVLKNILKGKKLSKYQMQIIKRKLLKKIITNQKNVTDVHMFQDSVKKKKNFNMTTDTIILNTTHNFTKKEANNITDIKNIESFIASSMRNKKPDKEMNTTQSKDNTTKTNVKQMVIKEIVNNTGKDIIHGARRFYSTLNSSVTPQKELGSFKLEPEITHILSTGTKNSFNNNFTTITTSEVDLIADKKKSEIIQVFNEIDDDLAKLENKCNNGTSETLKSVILNSSRVLTKTEVSKEIQSIFESVDELIEELKEVSGQENDTSNLVYGDNNSTTENANRRNTNSNMDSIRADASNTVVTTNTKSENSANRNGSIYEIMTEPNQVTSVFFASSTTQLLKTNSENATLSEFNRDNVVLRYTVPMTNITSISFNTQHPIEKTTEIPKFTQIHETQIMDPTNYNITSNTNTEERYWFINALNATDNKSDNFTTTTHMPVNVDTFSKKAFMETTKPKQNDSTIEITFLGFDYHANLTAIEDKFISKSINNTIKNDFKNVNYETFVNKRIKSVTENTKNISAETLDAARNILPVTDHQFPKVYQDAITHGQNTSSTQLLDENNTQLFYIADKSVTTATNNYNNVHVPLLSPIIQNASNVLKNTKYNFFLKAHDGEKNIKVIDTPKSTHIKVTKLNAVNRSSVNLKPEVQKLLLVSQNKDNMRKHRTYQNKTIGKPYRSNYKSLFPNIQSGNFKSKKSMDIYSSRLNRPYNSFTKSTAVTKNIKYNTYRPISKEELELLKLVRSPIFNTVLQKHNFKLYPLVTALNNSSAAKSGSISLQTKSETITRAANLSKLDQVIRLDNGNRIDNGLHLKNGDLNHPIDIFKIAHSSEINRISHPILEININSPQIRTSGNSPPMIEINGSPLPIEINRNSVSMDMNRSSMLMDKNKVSVPMEMNSVAAPVNINRNSVLMDMNRFSVPFDMNKNSVPINMDRNSVPTDMNKNSVPMNMNSNVRPIDINGNSVPMDMNRNSMQMYMNRNSVQMDMNRNYVPMHMNSNSRTIDMNRNSVPIDMNKNLVPMDMNSNLRPLETNRNLLPTDTNSNSVPMNMNSNAMPIDMNRNSVQMDMNRNYVPMHINNNAKPIDMNRNLVPADINSNLVPLNMNRNSVPMDMNRNSVSTDLNSNSMSINMNKNSVAMGINRNLVPMDINSNSVPMNMNRNSVPMKMNRILVPTDINKNSVPINMDRNVVEMNKNAAPMDKNRNSALLENIKNSVQMDQNQNKAPMEINNNMTPMSMIKNSGPLEIKRNLILMEMDRNSVQIEMNENSSPIEMNTTSAPMGMDKNSALIAINRNSAPIEVARNLDPMQMNNNSTLIQPNRRSMQMEINKNSMPMYTNRNAVPMEPDGNTAPIKTNFTNSIVEDTNNNSVPLDINGNPVPIEFDKNLVPMDSDRNTVPMNINSTEFENWVPSEVNKSSAQMEFKPKLEPVVIRENSNPQKNIRLSIPEETDKNSGQMEINRSSSRIIEMNKIIPTAVYSPSNIINNNSSHSLADNNRKLLDNKNDPSINFKPRISSLMFNDNGNVLATFNDDSKLPQIMYSSQKPPSINDTHKQISSIADNNIYPRPVIGNNKKSSVMIINRRNGHVIHGNNKNSRSMEINKKPLRRAPNQIKTHLMTTPSTTGIKQSEPIAAAKKKIVPMKEMKRKPLLTFENNKKPLSMAGKNRKANGPLQINRNTHSNLVMKNYKKIGSQKGTLFGSFEKRDSYAVNEPKAPRRHVKTELRQIKIGSRSKAVMTMHTQDFLSQHRTPRSFSQRNTKPYLMFLKPERSVKKTILRPKFNKNADRTTKRLDHKLKPKPVFIRNDMLQRDLISNRQLMETVNRRERINTMLNIPMWQSTEKPTLFQDSDDAMNFMFTDYMTMTRRPGFNNMADSNYFGDNYSPSPFYRKKHNVEESTTVTTRRPRGGRTIFFLSPTAGYGDYSYD